MKADGAMRALAIDIFEHEAVHISRTPVNGYTVNARGYQHRTVDASVLTVYTMPDGSKRVVVTDRMNRAVFMRRLER